MSLHFLLDGYNIIKQTPHLNRGTLEAQRHALISWVSISRPHGSVQNSITVVFDGKQEFFGSQSVSGVKVIFTHGQSADDLIKRIVEDSSCKKSWVVVSNDKDIKLYVRALGAKVLTVKEFTMGSLQKFKKLTKEGAQESVKHISLTQQAKITQELEHLWLKQPKTKL